MTVASVERPRAADSYVVAAAWCLIASAVLLLFLPVAPNVAAKTGSPWHGLFIGLTSLDHLLVLAGILGLARSGAMGKELIALAGTILSVAAFAALAVAEPVNDFSKSAAIVLYGVGSIGAAVGLILAGVATIRTGRWTSWRRFTPLASGLFFVVVVMPSFALPGSAFQYFIGLWGVTFLFLGMAMWAESSASSAISESIAPE